MAAVAHRKIIFIDIFAARRRKTKTPHMKNIMNTRSLEKFGAIKNFEGLLKEFRVAHFRQAVSSYRST